MYAKPDKPGMSVEELIQDTGIMTIEKGD